MKWKLFNRDSPPDGMTCVVGHFIHDRQRPVYGVWKFCYSGYDSYWLTKDGKQIKCNKYDNWCNVEDIIDEVTSRIEEEIISRLTEIRLRNGDLS